MIGISGVLSKLFQNYGYATKIRIYRLRLHWKEIVGEAIATHTLPILIRSRKLHLWVDSSVWMYQLNQLKPSMLAKINAFLGHSALREITFAIGPLPPDLRPVQNVQQSTFHQRNEISPELELCIEEYLKPLPDPGLKQIVRRIMIKSFSAPSSAN
jgi:predicted nucleic acid-binding Zn ribbon protein